MIVPSRGYESVPTVVYEATLRASRCLQRDRGIAEVVTPEFGLTGELERDAAAIEDYLAKPRVPREQPASQAYASADFTWDAIAERFEELYRELVQQA